jgi:hypothetical protein
MLNLTCKQVNIRFVSQNLHQQRIRYTDYTGAAHLEVSATNEFITVMYMYAAADGSNRPLKVLVYNKQQVVEVECEDGVNAEPA